MKKLQGSIILVAGTCIGSGMIALPMVMAKVGILPCIAVMALIWFVTYHTALINIELNLHAGTGLTLGELGKRFSGQTAYSIGTLSLKLLMYALLTVFLDGAASIIQKLVTPTLSLESIILICSVILLVILLFPVRSIDYINRVLFTALLIIVALLVLGLFSKINWGNMPLLSAQSHDLSAWQVIIPVLFTSFGFQVIFHTLTNYCNQNALTLKKAFFWGSLIPAVVYIIWTVGVLSTLHNNAPEFYSRMLSEKIDVGELVLQLSQVSQWSAVQLLVWWISLLAIVTSILGVAIGLFDSLSYMLKDSANSYIHRKIIASVLTVLPSCVVATLIPNAFISALGFAGMILVVIAILLPVFLFFKLSSAQRGKYYAMLKNNFLTYLMVFIGVLIITFEVINIFF